ncbi:zinc finger E-box-binding homeobox protein zag-1-like isoform X2 [Tigriopus californicus]|nr:zinc finger E-box-binding homeobox protein zag-1-like isoform X2 [Tigriopus californicus]
MGTPTPSQVGDAVVDSGVDSEVSPSSPESNHNERLSSVISDSIMETAETLLALKSSGKTTTSNSPSSSSSSSSCIAIHPDPLPITALPLLPLPSSQNPPILSSHPIVVPSAKCVVDEASKIQEYLRRGDTAVVFPQHPDPISHHEKGSEDSPESDSVGYEDESPEFALLCPKCSKPYHSINSLRDHLRDEHKIDPSDLPDVLMGISTVGKEPNDSGDLVDCKVCQKQFANVYRLQRHMISHDESVGLRRFKCNDCGKAFKFKHHLKEHVRIHTGDKPFECKHCGKRFSHSGSYSSHMTSKKCQSNKAKSNHHLGSQDHSLNDMDCQSGGPVSSAKDLQLQTEALVSSLTTPLALSTSVNTMTTASVSSVSPSTSTTSNTSSSTVIQLPTEPAPMLATATAFNPLFLNPFMLTSHLAKPELMNPIKALIPDLSLISPLNSLSKPHIADTLANMFGKEELDNLRRMLETVNATVTRSLLEDNLKKWSQEILTNNAILDQLSKAQPIPPESTNGDSDYPMSDGEDDGTEDSANKRSRVRTQISDEQASILRGCYMINPKPKREELQQIAERIGHPFKVVKVWFQNTRARDRREGRTSSTPSKPITPFDVTLNNLPISLKNLSPLPPNVVFSKFPTPPASMTEFQPSPTASPRPPKAETPLDLSTKRSTPCETPPPLVINSDPEDSEDEEIDDEEEGEEDDHEKMESDESDEEDLTSNTQNGDRVTSGPPQTQDLLNNAKKQFEKMIQDKLVSLSPSAAASIVLPTKPVEILPTKPLPDENLVPVNGIYSCDQCDKTFTKKSSITRHKYEHSDQRPHKCMDCDKAFKHKHHLTEHKRLHSGEKPFQCPKCLKRFSHSGSYSQHINHRFSYCKPIKDAN